MAAYVSPSSQVLSPWYGGNKSSSESMAVAEKAFQYGMRIFKETLTKDPDKRLRADQLEASSLQDVVDAARAASTHYESRRGDSKTRECITAFAERINHYGNIMDVLVQQCPQYVSLAWAGMRVLFGAVIEHETVGRTIITALNDVADSLPRVELAVMLYPTEAMQRAVASLYAYIIRFLIRAMEWHRESRLKHAFHSITRPAALRYGDLITEIKRETQTITNLSMSSSQAEQRDIYDAVREIRDLTIRGNRGEQEDVLSKLSALTTMVEQLRESLALDQAVNASARIELRCRLSDIQLTQALSFISSHCSIDHASSMHTAMALRDRHRVSIRSHGARFWTSPKLKAWNASLASSAILLRATYRQRLEIRDFCVSVVEQLTRNRIVCLWILRSGKEYSMLELFKSLILQAVSMDRSLHSDVQFSFQLQKFLDARFEDDYVNVLGDVLQHFKVVYIVVDTGAVTANDATRCRAHLHQLSQQLADRNAQTVVKVIVSSYGPTKLEEYQQRADDVVLEVGRSSARIRRRKEKQLGRRADNLLRPLDRRDKRRR